MTAPMREPKRQRPAGLVVIIVLVVLGVIWWWALRGMSQKVVEAWAWTLIVLVVLAFIVSHEP